MAAHFRDMHYRTHYHADFALALTVLATVTSPDTNAHCAGCRPQGDERRCSYAAAARAAGRGRDEPQRGAHEDHAESPSEAPKVGERVEFVVGYSDSTVHLHEQIIGIRKGRVEAMWRVAARGKIQ